MSWKVVKLKEITELITCGVAKRPEYVDSGIPFLSAKNVKNGKVVFEGYNCISEDMHDELTKKNKPLKGDILYTRVGSVGEAAVIEDLPDFSIFVSLTLIKPKKDKVYNHFLKYLLNSPAYKKRALGNLTGIGVGNLNVKTVREFPIPLPPLEVQKKIAAVLEKADQLRQLRQQQLEQLDELLQSTFLDMFGDPVTNPKGWEIKAVKDVCKSILGGGTPSKSNNEFYKGSIPWVTPKDMKSMSINKSIDKITELAIEKSSTKLIPSGSILMVIRSGILKRKLPVGINTVDVTLNQDMKAFIPNTEIVLKEYLLYFFYMVQKFLLSKVRAVTADNIEFSQIKDLSMPTPSIEIQKIFVNRFEKIDDQKEKLKLSLLALDECFNSLMQKAFKGELSFKN